ncbi:kinase-like domain-containing protein [Aspergillus filifer]
MEIFIYTTSSCESQNLTTWTQLSSTSALEDHLKSLSSELTESHLRLMPTTYLSFPGMENACKMEDPEIIITDYATSFVASQTSSPTLQTPALYAPPEQLFEEPLTIPTAADIWTLGVSLYEIPGNRPLFETFVWCPDDIIGEVVSTLGQLPPKWWDSWEARSESLNQDGAGSMWITGCVETPETCEWDVQGGEMRALEDMLREMMSFEPEKRPTAKQLLESEYMVKWALPAWERQKQKKMEKERKYKTWPGQGFVPSSQPDATGIKHSSPARALAIMQAHANVNEPLSY